MTRRTADGEHTPRCLAAFDMRRTISWLWLEAVLLAMATGVVDAVGYLQVGIFVANMTGNTVLVGIALGEGQWTSASNRAAALLVFFLGAAAGYVLRRRAGPDCRWPLIAEAFVLVVAATSILPMGAALSLVAFAMGLQAAAVTTFGGVALSTVVVTSSMVRIAEGMVQRISPDMTAKAPVGSRLLFGTWLAYASGAVVGAIVFRWVGSNSGLLLSAALVMACVFLARLRHPHQSVVV